MLIFGVTNTHRKLSNEFEKINFGSAYSLYQHSCYNVELEDICGYSYIEKDTQAVKENVVSILKRSGYSVYPHEDRYIAINKNQKFGLNTANGQ